MEMISESIVAILQTGKRAVIPGLGAFLRKEGEDKVVFVEFLKKDDGVLAELLGRQYGLSAREAQEAVGGFVGDLHRMVTTSDGFVIEGLGTMRIDANGVLDLEYDPAVEMVAQAVEPVSVAMMEEVLGVSEEEFEIVVADEPMDDDHQAPEPRQEVFERDRADNDDPMVVEFEPSRPTPKPIQRPVAPPIFEGESTEYQDNMPEQAIYHRPPGRSHAQRKKQSDSIMIIAIVAAALAILAMIYGRVAERRSRLPEPPPTEQPAGQTDTLETPGNI